MVTGTTPPDLPKLVCGGCRTCCLGDTITLQPQDDVASYKTKLVNGERQLAKGKDGNCVYLGRAGCQIYNRQPIMCRTMDCRKYALFRTDLSVLSEQQRPIVLEGRRRLRAAGLWNDNASQSAETLAKA